MMNNTSNDFERIVIDEIPLIDVRAPIEFEKGAYKNAVNLPLMNNEERHQVGICYKEKGSEDAVKLGYELVSGEIRQARIEAWISFLEANPQCMIYCFRGGMRSKISQEWIFEETGKMISRLEGGYKAFRNYLISALDPLEQKAIPILLGGYTGSGKTRLLKNLDSFIDLEGIANHRGSSFGGYITPQPNQINFENNLAQVLIKLKHKDYKHMLLEDEGSHIGRCFIPKPIFEYFNRGSLVILDVSIEERVANTLKEYVIDSQADYIKEFGQKIGLEEWYTYISTSISKLKKRLGADRFSIVSDLLHNSYKEQLIKSNVSPHESWIEILLKEYYDPMYQYQIQNNTKKILFKGNTEEVLEYFKNLSV